jgi:integrase
LTIRVADERNSSRKRKLGTARTTKGRRSRSIPIHPDLAKLRDIGFEHGRLHSFRHFFCSQCFVSGASEGEIKEWLGHADSKMVEHYRHLRSEDAQRKMQQVDFFGRRSGDDRPSGVA